MQKLIFCKPFDLSDPDIRFSEVQELLNEGYTIESVTPQQCSIASTTGYTRIAFGGFVVVLNSREVSL